MKKKVLFALVLAGLLVMVSLLTVAAVSGAAFTTFNAHVDGASKDVCKNSAINCNIYGAKEYVWLNGGPTANGLGPDGQYFFAVLVPGGQPNPNDGGAKNLSDDYDLYTNRTFTVTDGEVSAYTGTHWLDDGKSGPKPNGLVPYIRLFPYADTTNPGGVYIMAICSLEDGYPVDPRDCKYDAFKVKKGKLPYSFMLSGIKFEDTFADGVKDATDPGLPGWTITIKGTGPDGNPIDASVVTGAGGYWEWFSLDYEFLKGVVPQPVHLEICEVLKEGWHQSYPNPACYTLDFAPVVPGFDSFYDLDFGNWYPGEKSGMKFEDLHADGKADWVGGYKDPGLKGWTIYVDADDSGTLTAGDPSAVTGADGKYTIKGIKPRYAAYKVYEVKQDGWTCSYPTPCYYEEQFKSQSVLTGNDFGNWYPATKGGYKWYDRNGDTVWDATEPAISGWPIEVYQDGALVDSMLTDAQGYYEFSLTPGTYTVKEVCPATGAWYQTWPVPVDGCGSGVYVVTLVSSQVETDNNFGNYCKAYADFGTKGYWHNKNGLAEITQADIDYVNDLLPYRAPTFYWQFPFDGVWDAGTDEYFGTGAWAEISDFLADRVNYAPIQKQLLQQLLAFIFNARHRLDGPGAVIYVNGQWMSAQSIIDAAIAAWETLDTDDDKYWEPIIDGLNNMDSLPYIPWEPCAFTCQ